MPESQAAEKKKVAFVPWVAAIAAAALMWGLTMQLDTAENDRFHATVRSEVLLKLSALRSRLESTLNRLAYVDESIALYVAFNPEINANEYALLAGEIMSGVSGVEHLTLIKGTVIHNIYPFAQYSSAIGLDLRKLPELAPALNKVLETKQPVLAGPLVHRMGNAEPIFIVLRPIYLATETAYASRGSYWGLCDVAIKQKYLYAVSGLETDFDQLNIAIMGANAQGAKGEVFFGDTAVFGMNPVKQVVNVPGGEWIIAAVPKAGWMSNSPAIWHIRGLGLLVSLTMALLIWFLVRNPMRLRLMVREATAALEDARTNLEQRVAKRTAELQQTNDDLHDALNKVKTLSGLLPICASCKKVRDDQGYWNQIEDYLKEHSDADFSHSICPECMEKLYPEVVQRMREKEKESS